MKNSVYGGYECMMLKCVCVCVRDRQRERESMWVFGEKKRVFLNRAIECVVPSETKKKCVF